MFWLRVKEVFLNELGLQTIDRDEVFYILNIDRQLKGAVITHFDDFNLVGTDDFVEKVISVV